MFNIRFLFTFWLVFFLASCVTINVYFPAAAAEEAADRIIDHVLGEDAKQDALPLPGNDSSQQYQINTNPVRIMANILGVLTPNAHAAADIDISSPAINKLRSSMQLRHGKLSPYFKSGTIGYGAAGLVIIRDQAAVALRERAKLKQLVAQENRDRNALYKALAYANGHPEWESQIRDIFERRWIAKAPKGWYYQDVSGNWHQK